MLDRFFGPRVGMTLLFITALGLLLPAKAQNITEGFVAGALIGFTMGGEVTSPHICWLAISVFAVWVSSTA